MAAKSSPKRRSSPTRCWRRSKRSSPLAPLHNPVNVAGIREMRRLFPAVPHVAVFDTAFHHTLPAYAYLYGLPYALYEKNGVRRYGFHGTSHQYVSLRAAQFLGRRPNELRLVSCHLGNGSSLCAVDHGRSVDTTMGFTPAEGLIMGTRCGDVDAGVLAFLERTRGPHGHSERGNAQQEERPAWPVRRFERHARNPQGCRRGTIPARWWRSRRTATACGNTSAPMWPRWAGWTR